MNTFVRPTTILRLFLIQLAAAGCLTASAAVTFSISPSTISNTYSGFITIQATGLNSHEAVVVQRYLDLNSNGLIDSPDWLMLQFQVTDGQGPSLIGGATNINVPFDSNSSTGSITIQLNPAGEGIAQILFFRADAVCQTSYADKKGKYQDQKGLTLPFVVGPPQSS